MNHASYCESFLRAVRYDPGPASPFDAYVVGAGDLSPAEALAVYRRGYWYRLVDALFDLLPRTAVALGKATFTRLACTFIDAFPSRFVALEELAAPFARFLFDSEIPAVVRDLAVLEGALMQSLLAPDGEGPLLSAEHVRLPNFSELSVRPLPSAKPVRSSAGALALFRSLEGGEPHDKPTSDLPPAGAAEWAVFVRPSHAVLLRRLSFDAVFPLLGADAPPGDSPPLTSLAIPELIGALAGPTEDATQAVSRLVELVTAQLFEVEFPCAPSP